MDSRYGLSAEVAEMHQRRLLADASRARVARQAVPVRTSRWRSVLRVDVRGVIGKFNNATSPVCGAAPDGSAHPGLFLLSGLARVSGS